MYHACFILPYLFSTLPQPPPPLPIGRAMYLFRCPELHGRRGELNPPNFLACRYRAPDKVQSKTEASGLLLLLLQVATNLRHSSSRAVHDGQKGALVSLRTIHTMRGEREFAPHQLRLFLVLNLQKIIPRLPTGKVVGRVGGGRGLLGEILKLRKKSPYLGVGHLHRRLQRK